jgi:hypothetical protein
MFSDIEEKEIFDAIKGLGLSADLIEEFYPKVFEPIGKPSQLDLTAREFFYWTDKGVIDLEKSEEGQSPWSRLNLFEILWIRIVKELRAFNIPFAPIVVLKNELFGSILTELKENQEFILPEINKHYKDPAVVKFITKLIDADEIEAEDTPKEIKLLFSLIAFIVSEIFFYRSNISLIVYKSKNDFCFTVEGFKNQHLIQRELDEVKTRTHLTLNLRSIVAEYLMEPELEQLNEEFGFVTEDEKELIKVIRDKQVKEIHIKKDDNEVLTYIATSKREIKDDQVAAIKRLLRMNEFEDVRVVLRNDKHLYIENKKKVKIRPDKTAQKKNKN